MSHFSCLLSWSSVLLRGIGQVFSLGDQNQEYHHCSRSLSVLPDSLNVKSFCTSALISKREPSGLVRFCVLTLPIMKMLVSLVAKLLPVLSLTCTTSNEPGWRSLLVITPIRPKLAPPVTIHKLPKRKRMENLSAQVSHMHSAFSGERDPPVSNLMKSVILLVSRSMRTVSLALMRGSG